MRTNEAVAHFGQARTRMPQSMTGCGLWWLMVVALGQGLNESRRPGAVLGWIAPLLERYPRVGHLHFMRGEALRFRLLGRPAEALESLYLALQLPPPDIDWNT